MRAGGLQKKVGKIIPEKTSSWLRFVRRVRERPKGPGFPENKAINRHTHMNTAAEYPALVPYLVVKGAAKAIEFHKWMLQHKLTTVPPDEMQKRWDAMVGQCSPEKR